MVLRMKNFNIMGLHWKINIRQKKTFGGGVEGVHEKPYKGEVA